MKDHGPNLMSIPVTQTVSNQVDFFVYVCSANGIPDPMGTTGLKQRLIKEDNDLGLISSEYAPRLDRTKSKVDSFEVTTLTPPPDSEWVRPFALIYQ